MQPTYHRDLLAREVTRLPVEAVRHVPAMQRYALDLATHYRTATADTLADKLLTVWQGSDRLVRLLVALAAIEEADAHQLAA